MLNVLLQEWARNNPEQARAVNSIVEGFFIALTEAGRKLYPILEELVPEVAAARLKKRYEETGIAIQIDEATRLAFLIMALRIPYTGPDPRPDGIIGSIRDYEILAYGALHNDRLSLSTLIEDSKTNPVAYRAVQEALRHLRDTGEVPSELRQWAYDVAVEDRTVPTTGPGRSPFTNQVRDSTIIGTMEILISCGLRATRNDASEPISAADAVSKALTKLGIELQTESVSKIWTNRAKKPFPMLTIDSL